MTANLILEQALQLPAEEREELCEELWASLASEGELTAGQQEELQKRIEDHRRNPDDVIAWDDLKMKWNARYGWSL